MTRRRAYVFMDANSLLRFVYAIATARHNNVQTPLRRVVESSILQILVTSYVLNEVRENIAKFLSRARLELHGWNLPREEVVKRVLSELESMLSSGVVVNVESPRGSSYAKALQAVLSRPTRKQLLRYKDVLVRCVLNAARNKEKMKKDVPVVEGILLAYDVAAAVPLESRAGITTPPFLVVTDDRDLFQALDKCLRNLDLSDKIILRRYDDFKKLLTRWV